MRKHCGRKTKYWWLVAFGIGLLVASFLPPKCLVGLLAAFVIILGITSSKC